MLSLKSNLEDVPLPPSPIIGFGQISDLDIFIFLNGPHKFDSSLFFALYLPLAIKLTFLMHCKLRLGALLRPCNGLILHNLLLWKGCFQITNLQAVTCWRFWKLICKCVTSAVLGLQCCSSSHQPSSCPFCPTPHLYWTPPSPVSA